MTPHHVQRQRQFTRFGLEEADVGPIVGEFHSCPVVMAAAKALIDDLVGLSRNLHHITKGSECHLGQGFYGDQAAHPANFSSRRSSAIRSTWRQASANSVLRSLLMRLWKASRIVALVLSFTAMMKGKPNLLV